MTDNKPTKTQNSPDAVATSADINAYLANIRQHRAGGGTGRLRLMERIIHAKTAA